MASKNSKKNTEGLSEKENRRRSFFLRLMISMDTNRTEHRHLPCLFAVKLQMLYFALDR